jgi:hypothetical protein
MARERLVARWQHDLIQGTLPWACCRRHLSASTYRGHYYPRISMSSNLWCSQAVRVGKHGVEWEDGADRVVKVRQSFTPAVHQRMLQRTRTVCHPSWHGRLLFAMECRTSAAAPEVLEYPTPRIQGAQLAQQISYCSCQIGPGAVCSFQYDLHHRVIPWVIAESPLSTEPVSAAAPRLAESAF